MRDRSYEAHVRALARLFPREFVRLRQEFDGSDGIWTGYGESRLLSYWNDHVDPKLAAYLERWGLYIEWHDPGTAMLYKA